MLNKELNVIERIPRVQRISVDSFIRGKFSRHEESLSSNGVYGRWRLRAPHRNEVWPSEYASKFYAAEMALGIEDMAGYRGI
jgi:hypothetical protein